MLRTIEDFAETLKNAKVRGRKCTVLIGAGCSVKAGIPTASGFVNVIQEEFPRAYKRAVEKTYPKCMAELSAGEQRDLIARYIDSAKLNWAHIAMAQLMQAGYVDRVLTTNFDLLVIRACAMLGFFPASYDFAASQYFKPADVPEQAVFYLHGQRTGFVLINTDEDFQRHSKLLAPVFEDAGRGRVWLVVGYSGQTDPVFDHLARVEQFDNDLFWIGYQDNEPAAHLRERLLVDGKSAYYVKGFDADSFFVTLGQILGCFPPDLVGKPFTYLQNLLDNVTAYTFPKLESAPDALYFARKFVKEAIIQKEEIQGDVLTAQVNLLARNYDQVIALKEKYEDELPPDVAEAVAWAYVLKGTALDKQAGTKTENEAEPLWQLAIEQYQAALAINPKMPEAFNIWGNVLDEQARTKSGGEADQLWQLAYEKYAEAVKIKPEFNPARYSWARALDAQAKTQSGAEADRLRQLAEEKVAEALKIKAELPEALDSWAALRRDQLNLRTGAEARKVLVEAKDVLIRAAARGEGKAAYNLACVCALLGEEDECRMWLEKARDARKLPSREHMEQDKDLDTVRYTEWFKQFLNEIK